MSTYEINSCNNIGKKMDFCEKDALISKLKTYIFELESNEKDYEALKEKYRQLQNEFALLSEAKLRLEYELKQKDECYKSKICDLSAELENLRQCLTEKNSVNKKLFSDNDVLSRQLDMKNSEVANLNCRLNEMSNQLDKVCNEKCNLEKMVDNLNNLKDSNSLQISKLTNDNTKLAQICQDQDRDLKCAEQERLKLNQQIDDLNCTVQNLQCKLHDHCEQIQCLQQQLDRANADNAALHGSACDLERQCAALKDENENLKCNLNREQALRQEEQKKGLNLGCLLNDRENELARLKKDFDTVKTLHMRVNEEKADSDLENQKLREHIMILTNQNEKLANELRCILEEDFGLINVLKRTDRVSNLLNSNKACLEDSLNALDQFLSKRKIPGGTRTTKDISIEENMKTYERGMC